jgi:hypothetical protein
MNLSHVLVGVGRDREALDDAQEGYQRARQLGLERAIGSYVAANLAQVYWKPGAGRNASSSPGSWSPATAGVRPSCWPTGASS